ncbi:MAG: hypothetical protein IPN33_20840 [Saprospiraceae bacterium]|nr:hypothetical protein [Saprospiraceae bacterium]
MTSNQLLANLSGMLSKGDQVEITWRDIALYPKVRASAAWRIADNRVETMENAITNYNKGVLRNYIQRGSLIITKQPVHNPQTPVKGAVDPNGLRSLTTRIP